MSDSIRVSGVVSVYVTTEFEDDGSSNFDEQAIAKLKETAVDVMRFGTGATAVIDKTKWEY